MADNSSYIRNSVSDNHKIMRIGIDISQVVYEGTGVSRFTKGLIDAILTYDRNNEWVFFFSGFRRKLDGNLKKRIQDKGYKFNEWIIPPKLLAFLWNKLHGFFLSSSIYHLTSNLDWFISSDWTEPPFQNIKKATVVHDLAYLRYPETVDEKVRAVQNKRLQWVKKESKIIFTDSHSTKNDLIELLHIEENRIVVNYPGVGVIKPTKNQIQQTLKKYNLDSKKFILTVGKLEPRKNLPRLIQAFHSVNRNDIELVIAGPKGWDNSLTRELVNSHNKIILLGQVSDTELYSLYSSCLCFVYPSLWEGFGYPIIEAMKFGVPVTCSNTSSMKEIAKDNALLFNPLDSEEMYQFIDRLIHDENIRNKLIKKGLQRSKIFTWERYYNKLIKTLEQHKE